ncbi:MAG: M6 family metalloprotease domain-containing protein [Bacteroides sp.]|nr:M6 family metalloprotease domain-containing protein [Bacteroides sp.]
MRLSRFFTYTALAAFPLLATARPASPRVLQHVNPDGSKVEYRIHGDEYFSYMTDAENSTILEYKGLKELRPAMRHGQVLVCNDANVDMLRAEQAPIISERTATGTNERVSRMAALTLEGRSTYPTEGEVHGLVVLVNFKDRKFSIDNPAEQFNRLCNEEGYSDFDAKGSARDYYIASSNGKFKPVFDVVGPVELDSEAAWYNGYDIYEEYTNAGMTPPSGAGRNYRMGYLVKEAVEKLDPTVDFSKYDYDDDGVIDNIFFFYAGFGQADGGDQTTIWPHQGEYTTFMRVFGLPEVKVDGKKLATYACSNELDGFHKTSPTPYLDGIGAFCHEYGHVLGLPDLYETNYAGTVTTPGAYTVMDSGSYNDGSTRPPLFSAYEQWVCNWLEFDDNTGDAEDVTLVPRTREGNNAVRLRIRQPGGSYYQEYFVLESRKQEGWDYAMPQHGMLIWRINYARGTWNSNKVNTGSCNVELIKTPSGLVSWPGTYSDENWIYPSMNILVPAKTNRAMDTVISDIAVDEETGNVTFGLNKYEQGYERTVLHDTPTSDKNDRTITFTWDPVDGATGYALTVYRTNNYGSKFYIGGMNEFKVGNLTEYTVRGLTSANMNQELTAYVRVYDPLPSGSLSNTLTFVPAELGDSGVEDIVAEIPVVYGGKGCVVAPDDARVYNLSGMETGRENLAPGVYIVVTSGVRAKVTVR